jgi:hypothetical protein
MARIGDTPEQQRINEANESQRRSRVDNTKRVDQNRKSVAFTEVMKQKTQRDQNQQHRSKQASQKDTLLVEKKPGEQLKRMKQAQKGPRELARRAALARAGKQAGKKVRNQDIDEGKQADGERSVELETVGETDRERVRNEHRVDEHQETQKAEELLGQSRIDSEQDGQSQSDQKKQQEHQSGQSDGQPDPQAAAVLAASETKGANPSRLPEEVIRHIAKAIAVAAAKGGTSQVFVQLKGAMFEGVTLKVALRKGKVRCEFEGCDKTTRNLVESSKGELMRALAKKGLELDILRAR